MAQRVIPMVLSMLVLVSAQTARGSDYGFIVIDDYPPDGAVDVPLNPVLIYDNSHRVSATIITLYDPDGTEIPLQQWYRGDVGSFCGLHEPEVELLPETTYTVRLDGIDGEEWLYTFTTGTERDTEPPTVSSSGEAECRDRTFTLPVAGSDDIVVAAFEIGDITHCITPESGAVTFNSDEGTDTSFWSSVYFVDRSGNLGTQLSATTTDVDDDCYNPWEGYSDSGGCAVSGRARGSSLGGLLVLSVLALAIVSRRRS